MDKISVRDIKEKVKDTKCRVIFVKSAFNDFEKDLF